ncbi:hypothetical protein TanjilG_20939 [Lupinus angustifolius]|uniref:Tf2-1-like SH3-like domain-containing protein n=1 Tax=Lupinus angustifolius TaxID=3871 RepID=A0A1J7GC99_LUPAN|nr:hypothetical protein TanjilG_20939 [Lupinus angustifolius]
MTSQTQSGKVDITFEIDGWVLLMLQPFRQVIVARRASHKLAPRCFSPYRVVHRIGSVAYELALPPSTWVHLGSSTFHFCGDSMVIPSLNMFHCHRAQGMAFTSKTSQDR